MRLPFTLSVYIGRYFLVSILLVLIGIAVIVGLVDFIEMLRRAAGKQHVPIGIVLEMTLLHLPTLCEQILPFATLIGSIYALTRLTRTHELVVARAAGVSVWQFLMPALILALLLGTFFVAVYNPLSAAMMMRFEQIEGRYITGRPSLLAVSSSGLWLRQINEEENSPVSEYIIHSQRVSQGDMSLANVIVFIYGKNSQYLGRIDADTARLVDRYWQLQGVRLFMADKPPQFQDNYSFPTTLTLNQIQDSFASPKTMSFWQLPGFIKTLEDAGFSAMRHRLYWQALLSSPLLLCAMILIAATFSLRLPRRGGIGILVVFGLMTGFLMYFGTKLIFAVGMSGSLPIALAAWTPPIIGIMVGGALLLHLEDG